MKMKKTLFLLVFLNCFAFVSLSHSADLDDFKVEVDRLYNFQPHILGNEQQKIKSREMDIFWQKVTHDKDLYLPLLRSELANAAHPPFFFYDGSKLLLSISQSKQDKQIALKALPYCDLEDVDNADYLRTVHRLAVEGFDVSDAAMHVLAYPKFRALIPQHALTLAQDYSLIYMLIPAKEEYYFQKILSRLDSEREETAHKTLLLLLWYSATPEGDEAITRASLDSRSSQPLRAYAEQLLGRKKQIRSDPFKFLGKAIIAFVTVVPPTADYGQLKTIRKQRMRRISDEALMEFERISALLM